MIEGRNFFAQPVQNVKRHTYANILNIIIDQRDYYTTGCQLAYPHFNEDFNTIPIGLNKLQAFNSHGEAIQKINLIANKRSARKTPIFSFLKDRKKLFCFLHKDSWECFILILM